MTAAANQKHDLNHFSTMLNSIGRQASQEMRAFYSNEPERQQLADFHKPIKHLHPQEDR